MGLKLSLSTLDWTMFFIVLAITLAAVIYGNSKKGTFKNEEESFLDLILMGRKLTLPLFVATLVATWYGGIFGVTELTFKTGIFNFLTQGIFWYFTYLIFAFCFVHKIKNSKAQTLPELIGEEFGGRSQKIAAWMNLLNLIPISYAISIGLFLNLIWGGDLLFNTFIGVSFVVAYSMIGGFRAVVFSDLVQFIVMVSSVIAIAIFSISTHGGLEYLKINLPATHFDLMGGQTISTVLVWGIIALSTLVDPNFYQRVMAAKDEKTAKRGILISTVIWVIFDLATTTGALYARASMPNADSKMAYLEFAMNILPDGVRGFCLAGILAIIISTLDSYIFLAATTVVCDLVKKEKIKNLPLFHHLAVVSVGLFSVLGAYLFKGNIISVWKLLGSLSASCLLIPVIFAKITKFKIQDHQFAISTISSVASILIWSALSSEKLNLNLPSIDEIYIGSFTNMIILSYFYLNGFKLNRAK